MEVQGDLMDFNEVNAVVPDAEADHRDMGEYDMDMTPQKFQEILQQRKMEFRRKAEEKRQKGVISIAARKSKTGIDPLQRFPKEIWAKILEELSPADRASMCEVHDLFQDLMKKNRIRDILFPLVLDKLYPFVDIEGLRLVSKSLRDSVDELTGNRICSWMNEIERCPDRLPRHRFWLMNEEKSKRMLDYSSGPNDCRPKRLLRRSLSIGLGDSFFRVMGPHFQDLRVPLLQSFSAFKDCVIEFLEKVGQQVLFFELCCSLMEVMDGLGVTIFEIYSFLRDCVLRMPNLKWVRLSASGLQSLPRQPEWRTRANLAFQNHPIPTLNALERLDFYVDSNSPWPPSVFNEPFPIWDSVLNANPSVNLHRFDADIALEYYSNYNRYTEPSVLALPLEKLDLTRGRKYWTDFSLFRQMSLDCRWNLKSLALRVIVGNADVNTIWRCLEQFPALEELNLTINRARVPNEEVSFLQLPRLKHLKLEVRSGRGKLRNLFSLQFAHPCKKLESLTFYNLLKRSRLQRIMEVNGMSDFDFNGGFGDLSGSTFWEIFRKLSFAKIAFLGFDKGLCLREYRDRKLVYKADCDWRTCLSNKQTRASYLTWFDEGVKRYSLKNTIDSLN